jgi:hypothetical protein
MDPMHEFQTMVQLIATRPCRRMGVDGPHVADLLCVHRHGNRSADRVCATVTFHI